MKRLGPAMPSTEKQNAKPASLNRANADQEAGFSQYIRLCS